MAGSVYTNADTAVIAGQAMSTHWPPNRLAHSSPLAMMPSSAYRISTTKAPLLTGHKHSFYIGINCALRVVGRHRKY